MPRKPTGRPNGRPTAYTRDLAEVIATRVASGESLRAICGDAPKPVEAVDWDPMPRFEDLEPDDLSGSERVEPAAAQKISPVVPEPAPAAGGVTPHKIQKRTEQTEAAAEQPVPEPVEEPVKEEPALERSLTHRRLQSNPRRPPTQIAPLLRPSMVFRCT